jgi:RimJ/RimL family protein N-acetyltransferase
MIGPIETQRLMLRRWRDADREPMATIHADAEVMYWHGRGSMTREESDAAIGRYEEHFETHGFGFWAIERKSDGALLGMTGLQHTDEPDRPDVPCVEIGWRLARSMWGRGYATEAARAALVDGFERANLEEVLAWTAVTNARSQAVMRKAGMVRDRARDFAMTSMPPGHPLRAHMLFRISRETFRP